jgi:hypothetical protein
MGGNGTMNYIGSYFQKKKKTTIVKDQFEDRKT